MAGDTVEIRVQGLEQAIRALQELPNTLRRRVLTKAVRAAAEEFKLRAQAAVPVLAQATLYRNPGTLKRAIKVRTSKRDRRDGNVGAFVNVKLLPGAKYKTIRDARGKAIGRTLKKASERSAKNPNDPFYWRFVEFGTQHMAAQPFLRRAAEGGAEQAVRRFERVLATAIKAIDDGRTP